jgi:hypothetical protein
MTVRRYEARSQSRAKAPQPEVWLHEEGCFVWEHGEIKRITEIALRDHPVETGGTEKSSPVEYVGEEPGRPLPQAKKSRRAVIVGWVALVLSHMLALLLGVVAGALLAPHVIVIPERAERPAISSPVPEPGSAASSQEDRKK